MPTDKELDEMGVPDDRDALGDAQTSEYDDIFQAVRNRPAGPGQNPKYTPIPKKPNEGYEGRGLEL